MAPDISIYAVELPSGGPAKAVNANHFTKLRLPSSLQLKPFRRGSIRSSTSPPVTAIQTSSPASEQPDYPQENSIANGSSKTDECRIPVSVNQSQLHQCRPSPPTHLKQPLHPPHNRYNPHFPPPSESRSAVTRQQQQQQQQPGLHLADGRSPINTPASIRSLDNTSRSSSGEQAQQKPEHPGAIDPKQIVEQSAIETIDPTQIVEHGIPPLTKLHFSCYQFHRTFVRSNNVRYPLQCMTCLKADQQVRWRCLFCSLRICTDCVKGIKECKYRSLIDFMEKLVQSLEASSTAS
ncbi:hypothetical protein FQN57_006955 [Myotisia sp. PD_48]|nr:hypothetical protein FQN57_006955 [Myotisia sp. PD_48]